MSQSPTSQGWADGLACRSCAAAPTTCGAAIDVPDITLQICEPFMQT